MLLQTPLQTAVADGERTTKLAEDEPKAVDQNGNRLLDTIVPSKKAVELQEETNRPPLSTRFGRFLRQQLGSLRRSRRQSYELSKAAARHENNRLEQEDDEKETSKEDCRLSEWFRRKQRALQIASEKTGDDGRVFHARDEAAAGVPVRHGPADRV